MVCKPCEKRKQLRKERAMKDSMINVVFNIETCRNNALPAELMPQLKEVDKSLIQAPKNYKKPEAIADYVEREFYNQLQVSKEKFTKEVSEMGLHPLTGRVCCISYFVTNSNLVTQYPKIVSYYGADETDIIGKFIQDMMNIMNTNMKVVRIITYNGKSFDLPYLMIRTLVNELHFPFVHDEYFRRYSRSHHFDIYEFLTSSLSSRRGRLKDFALLFRCKNQVVGDGSEVQGLIDANNYERIVEHCESNVSATAELYSKLNVI
jgi:predicted PolB exonuclease-like 3'-5' exonuclease